MTNKNLSKAIIVNFLAHVSDSRNKLLYDMGQTALDERTSIAYKK